MRTLLKLINTLAFCAVSTSVLALRPASTYTLVDPCARFTTVTVVPQTHNCYSIAVTNPDPADQDSYYTWNFGDGTSAHGKTLLHCYSSTLTGNYMVTLGYNSPDCLQKPLYQVYTASLSAANSSNCATNVSYTLSGRSLTLDWAYNGPMIPEMVFSSDFGDGTPETQNRTHTYTTCGNYILRIHSYDWNFPAGGCYAFSAINIPCPSPPTSIPSNKAGATLNIFPNPTQAGLTIRSSVALTKASVYDLSGRELHTAYFDGTTKEAGVETNDLAQGTYFLSLKLEDGSQQYLKFIKE